MLILASGSPRRQEILERAGLPFTVRVPDVEEVRGPGEPPLDYVLRLARAKAETALAATGAGAPNGADVDVVLAADTVVVLDDHVLEKPADNADAARMLRLLSGRIHQVITGICLERGPHRIVDAAITRVRFARLTEDEIAAYVATGEPLDKAGAYAIQGRASKFIESVEGCYFNIVGLPIALVYRHLKNLCATHSC